MYPNLSLEDGTVAAWYAAFKETDVGDFEKALDAATKTGGDFFPSPYQISQALERINARKGSADHSADREYREATLRSDWKNGIVWIVEHKQNHKVIAKERKEFVDSGIWADKNLVKRITKDGVITYHFGEAYPSYQSISDKARAA